MYITTAIPYVNAEPHLGFAFELVYADALARAARQRGAEVRFTTGTDENSTKNVHAARAANLEVADLVDLRAGEYARLRAVLNLSTDDFVRTSVDPRHQLAVETVWARCVAAGDIYLKTYRGQYCGGCESFVGARDLVDGKCPEHRTEPDVVAEENYFFRLSRYAPEIHEAISSSRLRIVPSHEAARALAFVEGEVQDLCISRDAARTAGWGIAVPGDPSQTIYVWFDALINYLSSLLSPEAKSLDGLIEKWNRQPTRVHVVGKGIARFHTAYWPAILASAGFAFPTEVVVHGYVTVGREKISKSLGNAVLPGEVAATRGTDALRYYLLRVGSPFGDFDFSEQAFSAVYRADLQNGIGNLVQRLAGLVIRKLDGALPAIPRSSAAVDRGRLDEAIAARRCDRALEAIWEAIAAANIRLTKEEPWRLDPIRHRARLAAVLGSQVGDVRAIGDALAPFLPETSAAIRARFAGPVVSAAPPLFPG